MNCPECGHQMVKMGKFRFKTGLYQRYKCQSCGRTKVDTSVKV